MEEKRPKQALYREYRSMSFDEVIGQDHITDTLKNALKNNSISHAYLFTGPRGVGKTSVARILAHNINDQPYHKNGSHVDIIEIDAASNRGIDEIRDLREKVRLAPTQLKYKVYIIDEVHMLTTPAFNALLKTLEEPPAHVVFILATTEAHKLPDTIISRTQRFAFQPIGVSDIHKHLAHIAELEKVQVDDRALDLIAKHGRGSLRDSISIFDQLSSSKTAKISYDTVIKSLGLANDELINQIIKAINHQQPAEISKLVNNSALSSLSAPTVAYQLIDALRASKSISNIKTIRLIEDLMDVSSSHDPNLKLEVILIKHCFEGQDEVVPIKPAQEPIAESVTPPKSDLPVAVSPIKTGEFDEAAWKEILSRIKSTNNSLYAILRMAAPNLPDNSDTIILNFKFPFHKQRVDESKHKMLIEDTIKDVLNQRYNIRVIVNQDMVQPFNQSTNHLKSAISVMGGGEIMEYSDE